MKHVYLGVDVGYGSVKAMRGGNPQELCIPTSVAKARKGFSMNMGSVQEYEFEGKSYLLGDDVGGDAFGTMSSEFLVSGSPL